MVSKEPVLLTVLIQAGQLRWYVGGIGLGGESIPLIRSEEGDLGEYIGSSLDDQISFLRHRLSGVLQRGCDRLWARQKKPCQIVFLIDEPFVRATPELTCRVAEHLVQWMTSPPVVFFISAGGFAQAKNLSLNHVAGELDTDYRKSLDAGLPTLLGVMEDPAAWEVVPRKNRRSTPDKP